MSKCLNPVLSSNLTCDVCTNFRKQTNDRWGKKKKKQEKTTLKQQLTLQQSKDEEGEKRTR